MMFVALVMALSLAPSDTTPLTFLHGDEQVVTWLDQASVRRTGDHVRSRLLRVRHANQAFWLVEDVDCAARTSALVSTKGADGEDKSPPLMDGQGEFFPISRYDRMSHALLDAVCDGILVDASIPPDLDAAAARALGTAESRANQAAQPEAARPQQPE